ncbi:hypothetical protein BH23BAC2_BH23BAC2_14510 [soil metagenome]
MKSAFNLKPVKILGCVILCSFIFYSCREDRPSNSNERSPGEKSAIAGKVNDSIKNLIRITNPRPGDVVTSPILLQGEARGFWFFEAETNVEILDANFKSMNQTIITAQGEWMTEDWVSFTGKLEFSTPATQQGFVVFHKANASGLAEHEGSDTISVRF